GSCPRETRRRSASSATASSARRSGLSNPHSPGKQPPREGRPAAGTPEDGSVDPGGSGHVRRGGRHVRITVIGCSGSFPGPESPASCYLIEPDGFALLLDLGNGALGPLQRHIGLYEIGAVLLSHLHADHCLDLCGYWVARRYAPGGPKPRIPVYGPRG